jgi:hypothetical protein
LNRVDLPALGRPRIATREPGQSGDGGFEPRERSRRQRLPHVLGEIDRRGESGRRRAEILSGLRQAARDRPLESADGKARGRLGPRLDQVPDRFGFQKIHLPEQEGPFRELSGTGRARAGGDQSVEHLPGQDRAAVDRQLRGVLSRRGRRCREERREALIDGLAPGIPKGNEIGIARLDSLREPASHFAQDREALPSGNSQQRQRRSSHRGRQRRDRVENGFAMGTHGGLNDLRIED